MSASASASVSSSPSGGSGAGGASAVNAAAGSSSSSPSSSLSVAGWIVGSVGSSVGLILVNKVIMREFGFTYVLTLTALHFLVTALGMEVMALLGFFSRARLPLLESLLMAVFCIGSVACMNFSLSLNSVGFYQVTKLLCIPCMVAIQTALYGQSFSVKTRLTLVVVLLGVGLATVSDMELNAWGAVMGAAAVLFTAQFQIWQGDKQAAYKLNAMQMNHAQALPSFLFCLLLSFLLEHGGDNNVRMHELQQHEAMWILLSCILALSVNLCTYGLIGKTSPVTYQVVGHAKTCLILLGGFLFFPPPVPPPFSSLVKNLLGIAVALCGVIVYSHLKIVEGSREPQPQRDWCDALLPSVCLRWLGADGQRGGGGSASPQAAGYEPLSKMESGSRDTEQLEPLKAASSDSGR